MPKMYKFISLYFPQKHIFQNWFSLIISFKPIVLKKAINFLTLNQSHHCLYKHNIYLNIYSTMVSLYNEFDMEEKTNKT